jgi:hypothetical protein
VYQFWLKFLKGFQWFEMFKPLITMLLRVLGLAFAYGVLYGL